MFVSTNPRYQLVNGVERVCLFCYFVYLGRRENTVMLIQEQKVMLHPLVQVMYQVAPGIGRAGSLILRTGNNIVGGATWVLWARFIGLQQKQSNDD